MSSTGVGCALEHRVAISAIVFSVLAALAGIMGQNASIAVMEFQSKANLDKIEMADQWGFYQARRTKVAVFRAHSDLIKRLKLGEMPHEFQQDIQEYEREEQSIRDKAAALERSVASNTRAAEIKLRQSDHYDLSVAFLQIAIALVSLTVLVKKSWLLVSGILLGSVGSLISAYALFW